MTLVAIDADIVAWRCAAANKEADVNIAKWQADRMVARIVEDVNASDWKLYLSGDNNFRYNIYPDYKANRRNTPKPPHFEDIRELLVLEWDATICDGIEADDAIGILNHKSPCIMASIDKDLRQLPGTHYHFVNRLIAKVDDFTGWCHFYKQLLTGDSADNIKGCPGMGPVKSERLLRPAKDVFELYQKSLKAYTEVYKEKGLELLTLNANLLYVWRKDPDQWVAPELGVESKYSVEPTTGFSESMNKETTFIPHDGSRTVTTIPKPPKLV